MKLPGAYDAYLPSSPAARRRRSKPPQILSPQPRERSPTRPSPVAPDPGRGGARSRRGPSPLSMKRSGPPAAEGARARRRELTSLARSRAGVERTLGRAGFSQPLTEELTDTALAHTLVLAPHQGLVQAVRSTLAQRVPVAAPLPATGCSIVLVGAGGSGKTTCAAALLAAYRGSTRCRRALPRRARRGGLSAELILSPRLLGSPADGPRARRELAWPGGRARGDQPCLCCLAGRHPRARVLGELEPDRVVVALPATPRVGGRRAAARGAGLAGGSGAHAATRPTRSGQDPSSRAASGWPGCCSSTPPRGASSSSAWTPELAASVPSGPLARTPRAPLYVAACARGPAGAPGRGEQFFASFGLQISPRTRTDEWGCHGAYVYGTVRQLTPLQLTANLRAPLVIRRAGFQVINLKKSPVKAAMFAAAVGS